jgi:hypothetical protein
MGIVPPEAWRRTELCKRPLSWYWISRRAGQYLVVSSRDLKEYGFETEIVLRSSRFRPKALPRDDEKKALISRRSYLTAKPDIWDDLSSEDPVEQDRWLKVMGIRGIRYDELFLTHCANHANFIEPVYFLRDKNEIIPYSIAGTKYICSACLEFFNIIGEAFRKKLVVPCPGAVLFSGLPVNKYIEVETVLRDGKQLPDQ